MDLTHFLECFATDWGKKKEKKNICGTSEASQPANGTTTKEMKTGKHAEMPRSKARVNHRTSTVQNKAGAQ